MTISLEACAVLLLQPPTKASPGTQPRQGSRERANPPRATKTAGARPVVDWPHVWKPEKKSPLMMMMMMVMMMAASLLQLVRPLHLLHPQTSSPSQNKSRLPLLILDARRLNKRPISSSAKTGVCGPLLTYAIQCQASNPFPLPQPHSPDHGGFRSFARPRLRRMLREGHHALSI